MSNDKTEEYRLLGETVRLLVNQVRLPETVHPMYRMADPEEQNARLQDCLVYDTIPVSDAQAEMLALAVQNAGSGLRTGSYLPDGFATSILNLGKSKIQNPFGGAAWPDDRATRPDARSVAERKAGRRRYRKAVQHYNKTYTVTRNQALCWIAVMIGTSLLLSAGLFSVYRWMLEQGSAFVQ